MSRSACTGLLFQALSIIAFSSTGAAGPHFRSEALRADTGRYDIPVSQAFCLYVSGRHSVLNTSISPTMERSPFLLLGPVAIALYAWSVKRPRVLTCPVRLLAAALIPLTRSLRTDCPPSSISPYVSSVLRVGATAHDSSQPEDIFSRPRDAYGQAFATYGPVIGVRRKGNVSASCWSTGVSHLPPSWSTL